MEKQIARRGDLRTEEMPKQRATFSFERQFSADEITKLGYGHITNGMDDKWFWFFEDGRMYVYRSWTGCCIYIVSFDFETGIHSVEVNRDPAQYGNTDIDFDIEMLNMLLDMDDILPEKPKSEWFEEDIAAVKRSTRVSELISGGERLEAIYFHKPGEPNGFLSNWYPSELVIDGVQYSSAGQYIMYRKCLILGEPELAQKVMETDNPSEQQKIARNAGCSKVLWDGMRQAVTMRALLAKFGQNEELRTKLLRTLDAYLVECAQSDKVWACGVSLYNDDRKDMSKWKGKNILGFTLMEVRNILREEIR